MNMRIAAILLLGYCAGMSIPAFAQKKDKLKKGPNISLNISAKKDSVKTTYLNIGLLTNIYQLKGIGIYAVSSVVQNDMTVSKSPVWPALPDATPPVSNWEVLPM